MLLHLTRLGRALDALGGPSLDVVVYDGDEVSEANLARQPFHPADLNQPKATTLVNRINLTYGTSFESKPHHFGPDTIPGSAPNLLISCVDTRSARQAIHQAYQGPWVKAYTTQPDYYLDLGNERETGQVLLGTYNDRKAEVPLPTCAEKWPEMLDPSQEDEDEPSCSTEEALRKQDLFINDQVCSQAIQIIWRLFRHGKIRYHGAFCNLETGRVNPVPVPVPEPGDWPGDQERRGATQTA